MKMFDWLFRKKQTGMRHRKRAGDEGVAMVGVAKQEAKSMIKCSQCGRRLKFLDSPRSMFSPTTSVLGSNATMKALEQWRGNVCVDCRLIFCPKCITVGAPTPCPQCGQPTEPAQRVYVEQTLAPSASTATQEATESGTIQSGTDDYSQLVRRLKKLLMTANKWGKRKEYPLYDKYPQYNEVQEIGKTLNNMGGIELMRKAYSEVEGHIPYPGMSQYWWDRIGSWSA